MLPFGRLWYDTPDNAIGYAMHSNAVISVYNEAGDNIETPLNNRKRRELAAKHNLTGCLEPSIQYRSINASEVGVEL
jgi:hypothetical protein